MMLTAMKVAWLQRIHIPACSLRLKLSSQSWLHGYQAAGSTNSRLDQFQYPMVVLARRALATRVYAAGTGGSKAKEAWRCKDCGETVAQWKGRCSNCSGWNTMQKVTVQEASSTSGKGGGGGAAAARAVTPAQPHSSALASPRPPVVVRERTGAWVTASNRPQRVSEVGKHGFGSQWRLPLHGPAGAELARVLGGGVVPGSLTLIGGDPGVGKSTLLLQLAGILSHRPPVAPAGDDIQQEEPIEAQNTSVLYVSAEESVEQVGSRAERLGLQDSNDVFLYSATRLADILHEIVGMQPRAVIVDSIQTVYLDDVNGSAGSISQVRECTTALLHVAKRERVPIFLVGHVTKQGDIAGPRVLEHIVDTVLYMEGERQQTFRLIRGIKNRYGATDEVGVFLMDDAGLQPVANPSALFLSDRSQALEVSSAVSVMMEGTRPLLLEVQALCSPVHQGQAVPLRMPNGILRNRMSLILAVLSKHARMKLYASDIHVNVVGGLAVSEPGTDLAVAVAIASSYHEAPVAVDMAFMGELGLGGELRPVSHLERRVREAAKLGFTTCIVPAAAGGMDEKRNHGIKLIRCKNIGEALRASLGTGGHFPQQTLARSVREAEQGDELVPAMM